MGAQGHIDRHAGTHIVAEDLNDLADRFGAAGWALGQLNHHHKPHPRAHDLFRGDQDIEAQAAVIRHHEANARIGKVAAHNLARFWHQYADNSCFPTAFAVGAQRLRQHLIAVNAGFHLLRRQIQVIFTAFHAQEAIAIAMANNDTFQQVKTFRQRIALTTRKDQLTIAFHCAQSAAQCFLLFFAFNIQLYCQLISASRFFAFC